MKNKKIKIKNIIILKKDNNIIFRLLKWAVIKNQNVLFAKIMENYA